MSKGFLATAALSFVLPLASQEVARPALPTQVRGAVEIERLLRGFLDGAGRNDAAIHRAFWADDLVYTSSSGKRFGKAELMKEVESAPAPKPGDPKETYDAEDVRVNQYGDTAVLTFRLVARTEHQGKVTLQRYLNTGLFIEREGRWQAAAWQATKAAKAKRSAPSRPTSTEHQPKY